MTLVAVGLLAAPVEQAFAADRTPLGLSLPVQRVTLENGLRVVLSPEPGAPRVGVVVSYGVGSRHEGRGRTGFAHLFEHMMFQGSGNVEKGGHARLIMGRGGNAGGGTAADITQFYDSAPAAELPLVLWLEADRMKSLDVSEEKFENQRQVVREEVQGGLNSPYVVGLLRLDELVFQGYWPYAHSTGGSLEDLAAARFPWVKAFHDAYYRPNNAVLAVTGGFEPEEALSLIRRYFGGIGAGKLPEAVDPPMPEQTAPRGEVYKDEFARTPAVFYGIAAPTWQTPEHHALKLASIALGGGESSRLHRRLVKDKALAQEADASWDVIHTGPHLLTVSAKLTAGASMPEVKQIIEEELDRLGKEPLSAAELEGARRKAQLELVGYVEDTLGRATFLGVYELFFGDARLLNEELPRYQRLTAEDVRRAAAKYLAPARRSVMEIFPKAEVKP
jgi:zinc protease